MNQVMKRVRARTEKNVPVHDLKVVWRWKVSEAPYPYISIPFRKAHELPYVSLFFILNYKN